MKYDRVVLQKVAREVLEVAKGHLQTDGHVSPIGLLFQAGSLTNVFQFNFKTPHGKRLRQRQYKELCERVAASAAVVVTESWVKMHPQIPINWQQSLADLPDKQEAIVVEAVSPSDRFMIIQVFSKDEEGNVRFDPPVETGTRFGWSSEFSDGLWEQGGSHEH